MTPTRVPESGPAFEAMMREIDAKLIKDGVGISSRPLLATREVSMRYNVPIPISEPSNRMPLDLQEYAPLARAMNDWFKRHYGDRLKVDWGMGRVVVQLDGDLYEIALPRVFGAVQFVARREFIDAPQVSMRAPPVCNVVQLVNDLTETKAATLSDRALASIFDNFLFAFKAMSLIEANSGHELMRIAQGDVQTAVAKLMDQRSRFGESKWASLQATEKILKTAILLEGGKFKHGHVLSDLEKHLERLGIEANISSLLEKIQCTPGIRYGDEDCTQDDALAAHQASLRVALKCVEAGARFDPGLG
jgi:HEPN domain-containing protein